MKNSLLLKKTTIFALLVLAGIVFACERQEEIENNTDIMQERAKDIAAAQLWYETNKPVPVSLRASDGSEKKEILMKPDWSQCIRRSNKDYKSVETGLFAKGMIFRGDKESYDAYEATGDRKYMLSVTRFVVLTHKKKGTTQGFLMTIIPSFDYKEKTNFKPFKKMTYLKRDNKFSGDIIYHDLDGNFVNGWRYTDGVITHTVTYLDNEGDDYTISLRAMVLECQELPRFSVLEVCEEWYGYLESPETGLLYKIPIGDGVICHNEYVVSGYVYVCEYVDDGNGNGGGAGGYDPQPGDPPPNVVAVRQAVINEYVNMIEGWFINKFGENNYLSFPITVYYQGGYVNWYAKFDQASQKIEISLSFFSKSDDMRYSTLIHEYNHFIDNYDFKLVNGGIISILTGTTLYPLGPGEEAKVRLMCRDAAENSSIPEEWYQACIDYEANKEYKYIPSNYHRSEIDARLAELAGHNNGWYELSEEYIEQLQYDIAEFQDKLVRALTYERDHGLDANGW